MFFDVSKLTPVDDAPKEKGAYTCNDCKLFAHCQTPKIAPYGEGRMGILIILDEATASQDKSNNRFQGSDYNYLKTRLTEVGIDIQKDCYVVNSIRCYNDKDGKHGVKTMTACSRLLKQDIDRLKPKVIVPVTSSALNVLLYDRERGRASSASYYDYCGFSIPDQYYKTWIVPIFSPEWLMNDEKKQADRQVKTPYYEPFFTNQLESIKTAIATPFPDFDPFPFVRVASSKEEALTMLKEVATWKAWAFDYETNSLSPYTKESRIHSVSFSNGETSVAMLWYDTQDFQQAIINLYTSPATKVAHNAQFEWMWTREKVGIDMTIHHDPMIAMHVYHNQKKTGLKVLAYSFFGVIGFDHSTEDYIKSSHADMKEEGKSALNTIFDAPVKDVLTYCAIDSLLTYKIAKRLLQSLDPNHQAPGYKLFMDGTRTMARMSYVGFRIDTNRMEKTIPLYDDKIATLYQKITESDLIKYRWMGHKFNPSSDYDVRKLMYTILGLAVVERTDSGLPSVDEDALSLYKDEVPLLTDIMEYRNAYKILNTFIKQIQRENVEGVIHPDYKLHQVQTFRSSCVAKGTRVTVAWVDVTEFSDKLQTAKFARMNSIPIEDIKADDSILAFDNNGNVVIRKVLKAWKVGTKKVVRLHWIDNKTGGCGHIDLTHDHLVKGVDNGWYQADSFLYANLNKDVISYSFKGHTTKKIYKVEELEEPVDVYDLSVDEYHNFIANEIEVHNCSSPNWQNLPSRNQEAVDAVKGLVLPLEGHYLVEYDQSGLEMRGSGIISGDKRIEYYLMNPGSADMHKNMACKLFKLSPEEVTKNIRQTSKTVNFALLYGSYYVLIAKLTWKQMNSPKAIEDFGFDLLTHLRKHGIKDYDEWEQHCSNIEQWFWKEEFKTLYEYRRNTYAHMVEHGYIDYVNGFRYFGPASRNATCNAPIQGPSFHINLYTLVQVDREIIERGLKSRILGQVHDSIVMSVHPDEVEEVDRLIWWYGTQKVIDFYPWINLPLEIEKSATPEVNQPWSMKGKGVVLHFDKNW